MGTVLALFGVVLASSMADLLLPGDKGCGTRKYLHLITSLAVLLLILSPVAAFLRKGADEMPLLDKADGEEERYQEIFETAMSAGTRSAFREGVAAAVAGEFGFPAENVEVKVLYEGADPVYVQLRLSGAGLLQDPDEVAAYLGELLQIKVEVR